MIAGSSDSGSAPLMMVTSAGGSRRMQPDRRSRPKPAGRKTQTAPSDRTRARVRPAAFRRLTFDRGGGSTWRRYCGCGVVGRRLLAGIAAWTLSWSPSAAVGGGAVAGVCAVCCCSTCFSKCRASCRACSDSCSTPSIKASAKKMPAAYLVILVSTLPEPAPNSASAAAAAKGQARARFLFRQLHQHQQNQQQRNPAPEQTSKYQ